jgi:hypothetical protein
MYNTDTSSKFNSFQATLRKQFSHGFQMQAAYTFSRAFTTPFNFNDPNISHYALNAAYRPQRLAMTYSWDLPLGSHRGFVEKLTKGWNLAGVTTVQDGTPLTVTDTRGGAIYGFGSGAAQTSTAFYAAGMDATNLATSGSPKQRLGGANAGTGYFNSAAFIVNTAGLPITGAIGGVGGGIGWGNSGYGTVLGPGQFNFDATLQKTTKVGRIHEDATLVFRTEFFNAFNHAQFNNPTGSQLDVSKSSFGQITSTSVNPRLIQFGLKYSF